MKKKSNYVVNNLHSKYAIICLHVAIFYRVVVVVIQQHQVKNAIRFFIKGQGALCSVFIFFISSK